MSRLTPVSIKTIVVATDLSPAADVAVEQAAAHARRWRAILWMLHVFNDNLWASIKVIYDTVHWSGNEPDLSARNRLSQQVRLVADRHGIVVSGETRTGSAAAEIARFLTEHQANLLVVGEHGEDWIGDTIIGGTALKVLEQANVPVLLVRRPVSADFSTVIVATDISNNAMRAAQLAVSWFPYSSSYLAHAFVVLFEGRMRMAGATGGDIDRYRIEERARSEARKKTLRGLLDIPDTANVHSINLRGHPASVLFDLSERHAADLIVIGKHGGTAIEERLLGSVTQNVLYHASSNVLLVP